MGHHGHGGTDLPPFTLARALEFSPDTVFLSSCLLVLALYAWGVVRLRRRGDAWGSGAPWRSRSASSPSPPSPAPR